MELSTETKPCGPGGKYRAVTDKGTGDKRAAIMTHQGQELQPQCPALQPQAGRWSRGWGTGAGSG